MNNVHHTALPRCQNYFAVPHGRCDIFCRSRLPSVSKCGAKAVLQDVQQRSSIDCMPMDHAKAREVRLLEGFSRVERSPGRFDQSGECSAGRRNTCILAYVGSWPGDHCHAYSPTQNSFFRHCERGAGQTTTLCLLTGTTRCRIALKQHSATSAISCALQGGQPSKVRGGSAA
ncbi:hypothetical protein BCR34DRAFT_112735 [Clohesyomyces aquaticus]|uniref:Uncharacterized protein n=1 Tax=Clohesyomyces aquaticus TaxID=1231657 RepID=A0A1Y1YRI3_9PLEO|nr:hypothetical protein BCR34DRAFT_112735 [Clohesyomyces aquaticus]